MYNKEHLEQVNNKINREGKRSEFSPFGLLQNTILFKFLFYLK